YSAATEGAMYSPVIDLTGFAPGTTITARFNSLLAYEAGVDVAELAAVTPGSASPGLDTPVVVSGVPGGLIADTTGAAGRPQLRGNFPTQGTPSFVAELFDLTPFVGTSFRLRFRFRAQPDPSVFEGWYVDDLVIGQPTFVLNAQSPFPVGEN